MSFGGKMKIYLAGPLFSIAERDYNKKIATEIIHRFPKSKVYLPQEFLTNLTGNESNFFQKMFDCCINAIDSADVIVAILDGPDVDSGTCIELGYAYANKKPIIGVRTDLRSLEDNGVNLMVSKVCTEYLLLTEKAEINQDSIASKIIDALKKYS